jgi:hypothetical protein
MISNHFSLHGMLSYWSFPILVFAIISVIMSTRGIYRKISARHMEYGNCLGLCCLPRTENEGNGEAENEDDGEAD